MKKPRKYVSDKIKVKIIKNQNFKCLKCGRQVLGFSLQMHHKDGNPMNGSLDNLAALCVPCHFEIHGKKRFMLGDFAGKVFEMIYPKK